MGFFQRFKSYFSGGKPRLKSGTMLMPALSTSYRRGSREVLVTYRTNPWLRAVSDTVANGVSNVTFRAYKRVGKAGGAVRDYSLQSADLATRTKALKALRSQSELIEIPNHEVLRILNAPCPEFTGRACFKVIQLHLDLCGEAFLFLQRDAVGRVVGYLPLPPHAVRQIPTQGRETFEISYNGLHLSLPRTEVIHLKNLDPENPHGRGAGLGIALADELDTSELIGQTLRSTFARGGLPSAVFSVDSKSDDVDLEEAVTDLQKRYEQGFTGASNSGKVMFTAGNVNIATISPQFQNLQVAELDKALRDLIRQCFNVSPELLGDLTASNRATAEEAKYTLAEYAVLPRLEFLLTELQHKLVPLIDPDVILAYDDPRPASLERTQALITNSVTAPAFTMNEARELASLPPLPELEGKHLLPMPGQTDPSTEGK